MKLYINHNKQRLFVTGISSDDTFRVRDVSVIFGIKIQVNEKYYNIPCQYNPKMNIWFSVEDEEEAVCGTNSK